MKRFFYWFLDMSIDIFAWMRQNPVSAFAILIIAYLGIIVVVSEKFLSPLPPSWFNEFVVITLFALTCVFGILIVREKNAPLFIIPVRGTPAIIIGLFYIIGSLGLILVLLYAEIARWLSLR